MIPAFDDNGYLPPGIHPATMEEIAARFGTDTELRRAEMESVRWLVDLAKQAGVKRIILHGSFVTDAFEPNDVDCVLLIEGDFPVDDDAAKELDDGLPFIQFRLVDSSEFDFYTKTLYASDRDFTPKGMIEVIP